MRSAKQGNYIKNNEDTSGAGYMIPRKLKPIKTLEMRPQFFVCKIIRHSQSHRFHSHSLLNAEIIDEKRVNHRSEIRII